MRRVHAIVSGRVQGVSYRAFTASEAGHLGLTGWVRNRHDGTVELEAEGPHEQVEKLLAWCERGPPAAQVSGVTVDELAPTGAESAFGICYS